MNRLKQILAKIKTIAAVYWETWLAVPVPMLIGHGVVLLVLVFAYFFHHSTSKNEQKAEEANANVTKTEINANVQTNQTEILKQNDQKIAKDTKETEKRAKDASANYNSAVRRDSNSYSSDANAVSERFCRQFPTDSSCLPASQ